MREMIAFWSIHWERSGAVHWPPRENKAVSTPNTLVVFVWWYRCWAETLEICRQLLLLPSISCKLMFGNVPPSTTVQHWQKGSVFFFPFFSAFDCLGMDSMPLFMFNQCFNSPTIFQWNCGSNKVLLSAWVVGMPFRAEQIHAVCLKNTWGWRSQCPDLGAELNSSTVKILPYVLARSILCFSLHIGFFT